MTPPFISTMSKVISTISKEEIRQKAAIERSRDPGKPPICGHPKGDICFNRFETEACNICIYKNSPVEIDDYFINYPFAGLYDMEEKEPRKVS